ncbi:MAG: aldehyde dehydrogenase family protein, partial [Chlamydiales bacterium]
MSQNAKVASQNWSALTADERAFYLDAFRTILMNRRHELAEIISRENGKPLWESRNEVQSMIDKVALSLEAYGLRCAGIIHDYPNARSITRHRPHGAVAIFGPFNFPGHLPNGQIIPALLAGNTVIFKPSEFTPLTGETLANYWLEAGLPKSVLNVVQGGKETGQALMQHPDIQGAFFTGSYATGRLFAEYFGKHPEKILALEMGGNNPLIINEIDEIETAAAAYLTIQSAYLSAG